jgi:hypothetical protein
MASTTERGVGFLRRIYDESFSKIVALLLADQDFMQDVREATSLKDYTVYLADKKRRTPMETIFYIAPSHEQELIWNTIRGGKR